MDNNFMKELDTLDWNTLMKGVTFVEEIEGKKYEVKFTVHNYNYDFIELEVHDLENGFNQFNFTRNNLFDIGSYIYYFLSCGGEVSEEEMNRWHIQK